MTLLRSPDPLVSPAVLLCFEVMMSSRPQYRPPFFLVPLVAESTAITHGRELREKRGKRWAKRGSSAQSNSPINQHTTTRRLLSLTRKKYPLHRTPSPQATLEVFGSPCSVLHTAYTSLLFNKIYGSYWGPGGLGRVGVGTTRADTGK